MNLGHALGLRITPARGRDSAPLLLFGHGYGCDMSVWNDVVERLPEFDRAVFNWPGVGPALGVYDPARHHTLDGYADDLLELVTGLDRRDVVFVGHSMAASVGAMAAARDPSRIAQLSMLAPSPCFLDHPPAYIGGFERPQLEALVRGLSESHSSWASAMAPMIMGHATRPELADALRRTICALDPSIALRWGQAVFFNDAREAMVRLRTPTVVMPCSDDMLVPPAVTAWMTAHIPVNRVVPLQSQGHCPHVSAPDQVVAALRETVDWRG